jgi:hypothetical protein
MSSSNTPRETVQFAISVKNAEASATLSLGMACKLDTASDDGVLKCTATGDGAIGIVRKDILAGKYGSVLISGRAVALAGGTVHRGDLVGVDASSTVSTIATDKKSALGRAAREALVGEYFELILGAGAIPTSL